MLPTNLEKQWMHESHFIMYIFISCTFLEVFMKSISINEQLLIHNAMP